MLFNRVLVVIIIVNFAKSAKILGVAPVPSYSHHEVYKALWRELSLRGHHVTTITPFPINNPNLVNLTEIDTSASKAIWDNSLPEIIKSRQSIASYHIITKAMLQVVDYQLSLPQVQALIHDETFTYDLVIAEYYMLSMLAFAKKFNTPSIGIFSMDLPNFRHKLVGNPNHPVIYPDMFLPYSKELTFSERVVSTIYSLFTDLYATLYFNKYEQYIISKYFGEYPSVDELASNVSLVFINSNPVLHTIRPLTPSAVQIGGASHQTPLKPLPKDLEELINAGDGFIYFSLGTNVKCTDLSLNVIRMMLEVFYELPYTILWKCESNHLINTSKNVFVLKWWPQQDLLRHPKIKLFITQGGLQSIEEAIFAHVPMLGIPFFADQPGNLQKLLQKGLGLGIDLNEVNKETFKQTILEVINNPIYKKNVEDLANLAVDQLMDGIERAVWWTEYVLRHKGATHLKSSYLDIPWYQYLLLDVIAIFILSIFIVFYIVFYLISFVYYTCTKLKLKQKIY